MKENLALLIALTCLVFSSLSLLSITALYGLFLSACRKLFGVARTEKTAPPTLPTVSVLVPAYNEESGIVQKIGDLLKLEYPPQLLEIVVADDGSSDRTATLARELAASAPNRNLKVVSSAHGGPAAALKQATLLTSSDYVVWTDADATVGLDSVRRGLEYFSDNGVGAIFGRTRSGTSGFGPSNRRRELNARNVIRGLESDLGSTYYTNGNFFMFRGKDKAIVDGTAINYDSQMAVNIALQGTRVVFAPDIEIVHPDPEGFLVYLRRRRRILVGVLQSSRSSCGLLLRKNRKLIETVIVMRSFLLYPVLPLVAWAGLISAIAAIILVAGSVFALAALGVGLALIVLALELESWRVTDIPFWIVREGIALLSMVVAYLDYAKVISGQYTYVGGRDQA